MSFLDVLFQLLSGCLKTRVEFYTVVVILFLCSVRELFTGMVSGTFSGCKLLMFRNSQRCTGTA
jgi:hypothetical protein